jgi:hypothetical protein
MLGKLYRALRSAEVSDDQAQAAGEEVAQFLNRVTKVEGDVLSLKWMIWSDASTSRVTRPWSFRANTRGCQTMRVPGPRRATPHAGHRAGRSWRETPAAALCISGNRITDVAQGVISQSRGTANTCGELVPKEPLDKQRREKSV